jgi:hypothetical protein
MFQEDVFKQNGWYGYKQEAISNIIDFVYQVKLESHKTSDDKLNSLLTDFRIALEAFDEYASTQLFNHPMGFFAPAKETEAGYVKGREAEPKLNELTKTAFGKLQQLLMYLRKREYLD